MKTPIRIAYDNLVTPTSTVSASSAATKFPAINVAVPFRAPSWRSTGVASEHVTVTWPTEQPFNFVGLVDHNITPSGSVEVHGSSDGFVSDDQIVGPSQPPSGDLAVFFFDLAQFTSVRVLIQDPTNSDGYVSIGGLFIGFYIEPSVNIRKGAADTKDDISLETQALNAVPHFNRKARPRVQSPIAFDLVTEADKDLLEAVWDQARITEPFIVVLDPDAHPERAALVRFIVKPRFDLAIWERYSFAMAFKEAV